MWGGREDCAVGDDGDEPTLLEKDAETETIERERERESEEEEEIKKERKRGKRLAQARTTRLHLTLFSLDFGGVGTSE